MRYAPLFLLLALGCQDAAPAPKAKAFASGVSDAEAVELAKAYVLNNHPGAKILKVGPNLGRKEMEALRREAGPFFPGYSSKIRLTYSIGVDHRDELFDVNFTKMIFVGVPNPDGDGWIKSYREAMARTYPGIKVR